MIPFNYHHLYYFYVIAQEGSITKASKQLRLAQPTLSTQLKQFEVFLDVKLFDREKRKLTLSEEGQRFLSYAKMIFDIGQELKDRIGNLPYKDRVEIKIGISNFVPKTIVEVLLDHILKFTPNAYIILEKYTVEKLAQDLEDGFIDLVLTDTPFDTPMRKDINNKFIGKIPIVFCAHPGLAKTIKKFPRDLHNKPFIMPAAPRRVYYILKEYLYEHHIEPKIIS